MELSSKHSRCVHSHNIGDAMLFALFIRLISAPWIAPLFCSRLFVFLRLSSSSIVFHSVWRSLENLCVFFFLLLLLVCLFVFIIALSSCFILCICYFIFVARLRALSPHFAIITRLNCSCWRCHERDRRWVQSCTVCARLLFGRLLWFWSGYAHTFSVWW